MNTRIRIPPPRSTRMGLGLLLASTTVLSLAGCGDGIPAEQELLARSVETGDSATHEPSYPVEREFWLAMAEEPRWHIDAAREFFLDDSFNMASLEMAKAASILNFECRHSHSEEQEGLLLASVEEIREVARDLRFQDTEEGGLVSLEELDMVAALAYRSIAAHQVALARDALMQGDARTAGALSRETAHALQLGFRRGGIKMDTAMARQLTEARETGLKMQLDGDGTKAEGLDVLEHLDEGVRRLGNALTDRRK